MSKNISSEIANPVPPNHVRLAVFSYAVATELADDDDVAEAVAMMDQELRACEFAAELGE